MHQVVVSGASGFIGRQFVALAQRRRLKTLAFVRSPRRMRSGPSLQVAQFGDLSGDRICALGWRGSPFVHLAGASRDEKCSSLEEAVLGTTETVVRAAGVAGVRRIVFVSGFGIKSYSHERYFRLKAAAERLIRSSGIPYTILRSSYVLGVGDELTPMLMEQARRGKVEVPGSGSYRFQPLYVNDVVEVLLRACLDKTNRSYVRNFLGRPISFRQYVSMIVARVAPSARLVELPVETCIRRAIFSRNPDYTMSELAILMCDAVGPPTAKCFGVRPLSLRSFFNDVLRRNLQGRA